LQLAQEVACEWSPQGFIWEKNGKYFDALRPAVEPKGHDSAEEVVEHRKYHIKRVKELFVSLDLFIFTLGLTEMWSHKKSGTVYPTAPGTLVGEFDDAQYEFQNPHFGLINRDLGEFIQVMKRIRGGNEFKLILTVSPVPLTATASGRHVLLSTTYSKSTLRAIAGLWAGLPFVDYFPSYEIITNPRLHATSFSENLRSVRPEAVQTVMYHFFKEYPLSIPENSCDEEENLFKSDPEYLQCEEAILEAFGL
jgi:hypothetical protein